VAGRGRLGALSHRLARRRLDDRDLVPGAGGEIHRSEPGWVREGRQHPATGRFYDFFENRRNKWAIVRRQPIYEKDRMDPVDPAARLVLDAELLGRFPEGYRHLAYLQTKIGFTIKLDLPQLKGPVVAALYVHGQAWLEGAPSAFPS
jgi:hypothetical protein